MSVSILNLTPFLSSSRLSSRRTIFLTTDSQKMRLHRKLAILQMKRESDYRMCITQNYSRNFSKVISKVQSASLFRQVEIDEMEKKGVKGKTTFRECLY